MICPHVTVTRYDHVATHGIRFTCQVCHKTIEVNTWDFMDLTAQQTEECIRNIVMMQFCWQIAEARQEKQEKEQ